MEIQVHRNPRGRHVEIYIFENRGRFDVFYTFHNGVIVEQEIEQSNLWPEDIHPTMKIPEAIYVPLLEQLSKEASKQGVSTETENHLKGKLEATKEHLADMKNISDRLLRFVTKEPFITIEEKP